jgi:hypothetical protein
VHDRPRLTTAAATAGVALLVVLPGCTGGGDALEAAPAGGRAECAGVVDRLPERLLDEARVSVEAAGVAAWGDPAIVLRCGVPVPGPTSDPCLTVDDVDWLYRDDDGDARFVSYGRDPAVEVTVPEGYGTQNAPAVLPDLAAAVTTIRTTKRCNG